MQWKESTSCRKTNNMTIHSTILEAGSFRVESFANFTEGHQPVSCSTLYDENHSPLKTINVCKDGINSIHFANVAKYFTEEELNKPEVLQEVVMTAMAEARESLVQYAEQLNKKEREVFNITKNWIVLNTYQGDNFLISPDEQVFIRDEEGGFAESNAKLVHPNTFFKLEEGGEEYKLWTAMYIKKSGKPPFGNMYETERMTTKEDKPSSKLKEKCITIVSELMGQDSKRNTNLVPEDKTILVQYDLDTAPAQMRASVIRYEKPQYAMLAGAWQKIISVMTDEDYLGPTRRITVPSGSYEFPYDYIIPVRIRKKAKDLKQGDLILLSDLILLNGKRVKVCGNTGPEIDYSLEIHYRFPEDENSWRNPHQKQTLDMSTPVHVLQDVPVHLVTALTDVEVFVDGKWEKPEIYNYEHKDEFVKRNIFEVEEDKTKFQKFFNVSDAWLTQTSVPYSAFSRSENPTTIYGRKITKQFKVIPMNHFNL